MKKTFILLLSVLTLAACNQPAVEADETGQADTLALWLADLDSIDGYLLNSDSLDNEKAWKAFGAFRDFARKNPEHKLAPTYHMKAASIARNIPGKALMAIEEYTVVYTEYPQDTLAPQAQFLTGFTFEQALNDHARAAKAYRAFIIAWPRHPLATQANDRVIALESDEDDLEMVKKWQLENAEN
jgi:hypothetical protein